MSNTLPKPLRDEVYKSVDCPKCGRKAGERCYTTRAQSEAGFQFPTTEPHKSRIDAYRETADDATPAASGE